MGPSAQGARVRTNLASERCTTTGPGPGVSASARQSKGSPSAISHEEGVSEVLFRRTQRG
eukprot:scaffold139070_cov30-Tisochrysis_lutea.AAC.1